jgi:glycerophosphoryl diester phosphodiesterase
MIFDRKPSIVGHRGFGSGHRGGYRENTVGSFLAAVACGLSWVELDVHRSRDGELVVRHDPVAPSGAVIVTCTAAELAVAGVPSLAEVLAALPADVAVNIDVKTIIDDAVDPPAHRTHALVAEILHREQGTRPFLVSSFDPSAVMYLAQHREFTGDVALGLITGIDFPAQHAIPAAANLGLDAVCLHTGSLNLHRDQVGPACLTPERIIQTAHRAGLEVLTWSPSPAEAVRLVQAGADAVCVNDIPGVQSALASAAAAGARRQ